jgi:hypothetical protein
MSHYLILKELIYYEDGIKHRNAKKYLLPVGMQDITMADDERLHVANSTRPVYTNTSRNA